MAPLQSLDVTHAVLPRGPAATVVTAPDALARGLRPTQLRAAADWNFATAHAERGDWRRRKRLRRQGLALMRAAEALQASRDRRLVVLLGGIAP